MFKEKNAIYVARYSQKVAYLCHCSSSYEKTTLRTLRVLNLNLKRLRLYLRSTLIGMIQLVYCRLTSDSTQRQSSNHFLLENQHQNYDGNNRYVYASCQVAPVYPVQRDELVQRHLKYHGIGFVRQYHR